MNEGHVSQKINRNCAKRIRIVNTHTPIKEGFIEGLGRLERATLGLS